jgi:transcriptional antiterminator RfaH
VIRWYVICTHARSEHKAAWHLRNQGYRPYLPCYAKRRRHARRVDYVSAPLFPRYLFVEMDVTHTQWRAIRSTVGVSGIICLDGLPAPVPQGIVEEIAAYEDDNGVIVLPRRAPFERGQPVQIASGPLLDRVGLFETQTDGDRVVVLLSLLGREVRVGLPIEVVSAVT